ncbi:unnamed protein product [Chrysoparadoxa australica]
MVRRRPDLPLRGELWEEKSQQELRESYVASGPYPHLVVPKLVDEVLLTTTKEELQNNVQATLKETDIYKVYQSGDLANLDGLSEQEKGKLSGLMKLRNALYSREFRSLVAGWTGCGPLSGTNIDLSVNAFGHTGHLLCHDDVIGTRKVSYILYLVDKSWDTGEKPDGGCALQLYPLANPEVPGVPAYAPSKLIPPRWNQMVLFAVAPGHSFHDVQEVYNENNPRLAISGWFHCPEEGETEEWSSEIIAQGKAHDAAYQSQLGKATLAQLEAKGGANEDGGDDSTPGPLRIEKEVRKREIATFGKALRCWVNESYLDPAMVEQVRHKFLENGSTVMLHNFLNEATAARVLKAVQETDRRDNLGYQEAAPFDVGVRGGWNAVGPPHRRRLLRLGPGSKCSDDDEVGGVLRELREELFKSAAFAALLGAMTGVKVMGNRVQARRFRPGLDYTLATPQPWEVEGAGDAESKEELSLLDAVLCFVDDSEGAKAAAWQQDEVGGYQTYLGGDENDTGGGDDEEIEGGDQQEQANPSSDAAVYKADEAGSLLSVSASFNALSLVVRDDEEVLSFVKYVSAAAPGSRFDLLGEFLVAGEEEDSEGEQDEVREEEGDAERSSKRHRS